MQRADPGPSPLAEELGEVLARLYGFLRRAVFPREMSLTQALVLGTLRQRGPQRITDLAELEGVRQPTCTGLVNTMEAEGWVARSGDASDRRAVLVELTDRGREILDGITAARAEVLDRYLRGLSDEERGLLSAALPGVKRLVHLVATGEGIADGGSEQRRTLRAVVP